VRSRVWRWLPIVSLASLLLPALAAGGGAPVEPADARAWLARIHAAANQRNYQGVLVFSGGGTLSSSRVAHFCVNDQSYERYEALDGQQQRVYRVNDLVHTVWPQSRVAMVERRTASSNLPSSTQTVEPRALEHYQLKLENADRVAGREAQVLLLEPRDEWRYAQRIWADKATGLMLRTDVVGANGVLESTAFSEVEIGVKPQHEAVKEALRKLEVEGYRKVQPQQQPTLLENEGWAMSRLVAGFRFAGCVKRTLEAPDQSGSGAPVLQAVYSDGLTHVSVFIEPVGAGRSGPKLEQVGATGALRVRYRDQWWITVMGDVPAVTLQAFADALERRR
jgi:sigma-E factor negative regulatory protein RseB